MRSEYSGWGPHVSLITSAKPLDAIRWRQALLFHSLMDANESAVARERWRYAIRKRKARHVILNAPRHVTVVGLQVASPPPTSLYNSIPLLTLKHPATSILPPHHSTQKAYVSFCFHCDDEASNSNFKIKCWALLFRVHCKLAGQLISCSSQNSASWTLYICSL